MTEPRPMRWGRGIACGVGSAALFGVSAPLAKELLPDVGPLLLAGLLYLGAALGLTAVSLTRRRRWPQLGRTDRWRLVAIAAFGGFVGPVLLMVGLQRVSGVAGALLLNLEAVFTMALAVVFFGDALNRGEWFGASLILIGAAAISYRPGDLSGQWPGVLAVAGACLCWGLDNNLTQRVSGNDPIGIVQVKTATAGAGNVALALALGSGAVEGRVLLASLVVGFFCYGISIVLDVYALRYLGAAREAAFFATAPFLGALAAVPILGETLGRRELVAAALMAGGVLAFHMSRRRGTTSV